MNTFSLLFVIASGGYIVVIWLITLAVIITKNAKSIDINGISVIIAAKNEAQNLPFLISYLKNIKYPDDKYEVIIVNDHSTDLTATILKDIDGKFNIKAVLRFERQNGLVGKKAAIAQGIKIAKNDILAFTDADCLPAQTWLQEINRAFDATTDYVLGFADLVTSPKGSTGGQHKRKDLFRLKNFERSVYYALACAGLFYKKPITSSACNMAYRKSLFEKAGGFDGIGHLASGDDDLLLMKMQPYMRRGEYNFCPDLAMISNEGKDIQKRHHTNIRRASKFKYFPLWIKALASFVFLYFASSYVAAGLIVTNMAKPDTGIAVFGIACILGIKTITELMMVSIFLVRQRKAELILLYPIQLILFPIQFIYYALRGLRGKYVWK